jgi:RNA polymerase sigma-70 factor (ECF subfamily)
MYRLFGNFDVAEEAVQQAVVEALYSWRRTGLPERPAAWLQVAARNNGLDLVRRAAREAQTLSRTPRVAVSASNADLDAAGGSDDRLALLFACCHPALTVEARLALTLRAVIGLTTAQISRAFLVRESTLAQRIVRAKRKIVDASISLRVPEPAVLDARLDDVLTVVYLMYNEAFVSTGAQAHDHDLGADAVWLAGVIATSLPAAAEAWGLAALLTFQHARSPARFDSSGELVLLRDQDRSRWDHQAIAAGELLLRKASVLRSPGRYQLQAAIAAVHASAPCWQETDWLQIATLYDVLASRDRSPVVALNRAVAHAKLGRVEEALGDVDALAPALSGYHLWHATRAELLRELGRDEEAAAADMAALALTDNPGERRLLQTRLRRYRLSDGS